MSKKIKDTDQAWDDRTLGADEAFVGVADASHDRALDEALELQAISIRLPKDLIRQYKLIAQFHGVAYQPLMREVLQRFVPAELQHILETELKSVSSPSASRRPLPRSAA